MTQKHSKDGFGSSQAALGEISEPTDLFRAAGADAPKLRVGLLLDSLHTSAIFAEIIRDLQSCEFVDLTLVVTDATQPHRTVGPSSSRLRRMFTPRFWQTLGWSLYQKIEARRAPFTHSPFESVDCSDELLEVPVMAVAPVRKGFIDRFAETDVESIRKFDLDVIVRFGFNILRGEILSAAKYGVWSFHHGDNAEYRGSPPLYWEMAEGAERAGAILQVLTERLDDGHVLAKCVFEIERSLWRTENLERVYWGSKHMLVQKLWQLHSRGWTYVREQAPPVEAYRGHRKLYRPPRTLEVLRWITFALAARASARIRRVISPDLRRHWQLAIRSRTQGSTLDRLATTPFQPIESPSGEFFADPFLTEHNGETFLFFERLKYATNVGDIQVARLDPTGKLLWIDTALSTSFHLSYPHIVEFDGEKLLVPESHAANEVAIYRTKNFPLDWARASLIVKGSFVDSTLFFHEDRWWCLTTHVNKRGGGKCLMLFGADSPFGAWQMHPQNPLSSHPFFSRSAGAVVSEGGSLYRFSQDQSGHYGRRFFVLRIDRIDDQVYRETFVASVDPEIVQHAVSTHTYARSDRLEVVDVEMLRSRATFQGQSSSAKTH